MNDQEKAQAIEKANSYRQMTETWAFKDLMLALKQEKEDRFSQLMSKRGSEDLDIVKGFVQCSNFLEGHIGLVTGKI